MEVSEYTIDFLGEAIAGDLAGFPYRTGPDLVKFFNRFGARDTYGQGFPTRRVYAQDRIRELNHTAALDDALLAAVDPRLYSREETGVAFAVEAVNDVIKYDGYELVKAGLHYSLRSTATGNVSLNPEARSTDAQTGSSIDEQIRKCEEKIASSDYAGAITNARTLIETALHGIESELGPGDLSNDGDLVKQYKRVQKLLNLAPDRKDIDDTLKQVLSGLTSVVNGLAAVRNRMSDAHVSTFPAKQHHAELAVYSAVTLVNFLYRTKKYQAEQGTLPGGAT